ncbi:hypothetical protein [Hymenobacter sp. GOD-10R]|uniref:hypothetical protein n=1 Tax=Hymenobacter sp. GOD-10R TaxID=3093922 RepID=UPI002D7A39E8|nr:hypothetical protein [Hymenobacter sp. GOD-10R]WRQ31282.1 hypothetical protein SD425_13525 [Hymenobacter sp. GOD-10R]
MFELNPYHLPYATPLHVLMMLGTALLAYGIGQVACRQKQQQLKQQLQQLQQQLAKRRQQPVVPLIQNEQTGSNDLEEILGITIAVKYMLQQNGIHTFSQLGQVSTWTIQLLVTEHGPVNYLYDPATWPAQARLAADNRWHDLRTYQEQLRRGALTDLIM